MNEIGLMTERDRQIDMIMKRCKKAFDRKHVISDTIRETESPNQI